uniref:Serpentine Receptor, class T n=1 Tax=Rhabditophanes sp. KR3021 TaxID=114890 RepID=A0AC35TKV0_9BILA
MFSKDIRVLSSYKILIAASIVDLLNLIIAGLFSGLFCLNGTLYCKYPTFIFWLGAISEGLWAATCTLVALLAINRILEMIKPSYAALVFDGNRTYFLICIAMIWGSFLMFFTNPTLFSPSVKTWLLDPYFEFDITHKYEFFSLYNCINNYGTVFLQFILGICFLAAYLSKISIISNSSQLSGTTIRLYIQTILICFITATTSFTNTLMQFIAVPDWVLIAGNVGWIMVHGIPGLVFLLFNSTLRQKILYAMGMRKFTVISVQ